jgi:fatty acid desaturase
MSERTRGQPINWYWIPVDRELIAALSRRSDWLGALQTLGFLAVLACTGSLAYYSAAHFPSYATIALLFLHGTCWAFLANAVHELSHGSVFATLPLNRVFLALFGFLRWINPVLFWTSHGEHHKFAQYPSDDLESGSFAAVTLREYLMKAVINLEGLRWAITSTLRHAQGRVAGEWEEHLFPDSKPELRYQLTVWARAFLAGHVILLVVALYFHLWMLPVVTTLAPFYGGALQWICNQSQHAGLPGEVPDFRLCSRTIYLNPVLEFMYWHMNYHTDHHIYAAVPCYRLARLHRALRADLPPCPRGLLATWREIIGTWRKQRSDPSYRFIAAVPPRRGRVAPAAPRPVAGSAAPE